MAPNVINGVPLLNPKYLHPFGCLVWYKVPEANRKKLDPKGRASILLSYLSNGGGYRLWDLERRVVIKSRDIIFDDSIFPYSHPMEQPPIEPTQVEIEWPTLSQSSPDQTPPVIAPDSGWTVFRSDRRLQASMHSPENLPPQHTPSPTPSPSPEPPPTPPAPPSPRRSTRQRRAPVRFGTQAKAVKTAEAIDVPKTWKQVLQSPNRNKWIKAADEEFASLLGMATWKLVPRPLKRQVIRSKWVFKPKRRPDGSIHKLKARLVAMGYSQRKGVDFDEVFAPTTRFETLRLIMSILGAKNRGVHAWSGYQVDFKTAFLNGKLDHVIYMSQPPGYEDKTFPDHVCEMQGSLYGLKQSPRQWNQALHNLLINLGLIQSKFDPTLYFMLRNDRLVCAIAVHVDDLAVVGEEVIVGPLIDEMEKVYKIGSREELNHFLSLKITRDKDKGFIFLSQTHYIDELKEQYLPDCTITVHTPTSSDFKDLGPRQDHESTSPGPYNSLIGALLWVAQSTRADIAFAVNRLSQFLKNPSSSHWNAAVRILRYLITTKHLKLRLGGSLDCCGYTDSDWAEDRFDRRSTSAYTYRIGCGSISWKSRKQPTVSLSSTEAEYKALSDSCKEAIWLRNVLSELRLRPLSPIPLHVDNEGAEALAKNPEHHTRTKHIDARYHFIRECCRDGKIKVRHVSTQDMIADMLTKPLTCHLLTRNREMFGIVVC